MFNGSKVVHMILLFDTNTKLNRPTNMISSRALYTRTTEDIINNKTVSLACLQNYHFQYYLSGTNRLSSFTMVNAGMYLNNDLQGLL